MQVSSLGSQTFAGWSPIVRQEGEEVGEEDEEEAGAQAEADR